MNRCTEAIVDIHGVRWYYPEICVDGGVFRAKNTYTNLTFPSGSFKHTENDNFTFDPSPYSGHFYGIRKYTGLAPNLPYVVNITGRSGSSAAINIPTEIIEVEYNKNENYGITSNYSGIRLAPIAENGSEFGKSVASKNDLLAIGCPKLSISSGSTVYENAGTVFLYRRNPRPTTIDWPLDNYKSAWVLEKALTLPSGLLGDYSTKQNISIAGLPENFQAVQTSWVVGQDGREFGHSVDISVNSGVKSLGEDKQEILVVGGVGAKWNRTFDDYNPSGVSIGLMIFTDEFTHTIPWPLPGNPFAKLTYENILAHIYGKDLVFNYFADPSVKFDVRIIICVPTAGSDDPDPQFPDKPPFITLKRISKNTGYPLSEASINSTLSGITLSFLEAFPYSNQLNSGIPPILGICIDDSYSMGGREALEPAIDRFIDFYKKYSFASGLKDFYGLKASGSVTEYITVAEDTNWIQMSKSILDEVLDTGNLVKNNQVRFFGNNVGTFNENRGDFNIPPDSGGKVYIFEKESGSWNLIQEIRSPNVTREYNDRFGHAVSISDDGEVIVVGSPYINQAVNVYERDYEIRDYFYNYVLLNWIRSNRSEKYSKELAKYDSKPNPSLEDRKSIYLSLDQEDKFKVRLENNIEEYKNIYTVDYNSMRPQGSWSFIPEAVAPTSRLGYSVDVNENGSIVVAGAPTDSLNYYNDADVYYSCQCNYKGKTYQSSYVDPSGLLTGTIKSGWSSSLYAGSAHVFESRKYYPHNRVVEYGVFGNLHENISDNTPDSGHFMHLSGIFRDKNFTKTPFEESSKIPIDAGLAFIITPAVSRLSDEILDNIENWLSLGDRNLVLVGNDPRWEANGAYAKSNDILNKILARMQSRMRIVPARNEYESLPSGYSSFNNVVPSMIPQGSTQTYVKRSPVRASGVADIKIFFGWDEQMSCDEVSDCSLDSQKIQIQSKCEMPLRNYGDLRASWNELCCKSDGRGNLYPVIYSRNWPLVFGSYKPDCDDQTFEDSPLKNQEPIPLLVAAEKVNQEITYPYIPAVSGTRIIYETVNVGSTLYSDFGSPLDYNVVFSYSSGSVQDIDYNYVQFNITNKINSSLFYKPSDDLGGILQATATPKLDIISYISKEEISDKAYFALEYSYKDQNTSKINIIPSIEIESQLRLGGNDENILFYQNLVSSSQTRFGQSFIAQLNWNGRQSFVDAYPKSSLTFALSAYNNVTYDVSLLTSIYNVAFLPNINGQPSNDQFNNLVYWLMLGNKRLIITCDSNLTSINHAKTLCQRLGITLELLTKYNGENPTTFMSSLSINQNHQIGGRYFSKPRKLEYFSSSDGLFYPFKLNTGAVPLAYVDSPVYDDVPKNYDDNTWDIDAGIVQINVPVLPGSGYRLFITTDSQNPTESQELNISVDKASTIPASPYPEIGTSYIWELNEERVPYGSKAIDSTFTQINCGGSCFGDFQAGDTDNVNIYVSCAKHRLKSDYVPKTVRLVGISGIMIPIYKKAVVSTMQIPVGIEEYKISDPVDAYSEIIEVVRPVSTDNTKYCKSGCEFLGNQLIEDGPVVAAQEIEVLSSFDAGFARSRITVITDSSILQGRYVLNQDGTIPPDTYEFIRSLYPETAFFSTTYGRQFNVYNKIISPERGSPSKYHAQAPYLGLNKNFGNTPGLPSATINANESDYIPDNITRPKIPWQEEFETDAEKIEELKNSFISGFLSKQIQHAATSRISGVIDGVTYVDAPVIGGVPRILRDKGYDYLDFDKYPSGYVGDLFGYSVSVKGNRILVGSPFSAFGSETITPWSTGSVLYLGQDGGAGSVYMYEKSSNNKWFNSRKFRPQSLMGQLSGIAVYSDQFGHCVDMQNDVIAIGAPNHSYGNFYEEIYESGSFSRKNFTPQFDIVDRNIYDVGNMGGLLASIPSIRQFSSLIITCDESSIFDSSPHNHVINSEGEPYLDTINKYISLDGNGGYYYVINNSALGMGTSDFTAECWVYPEEYTTNESDLSAIIDNRSDSSSGGFLIWLGSDNKWAFYISADNNDTQRIVYSLENAVLNKWTHIAVVRKNGILKLFVDGILNGVDDAAENSPDNLSPSNDAPIYIGTAIDSPGNTRNFKGKIDNIKIIKSIALYDQQFTPILRYISNPYQKNIGAIYLYENKITDWENKKQSWELVEKVTSNHSNPSGERYGRNIYITRPYRSDADYCIFAGCEFASGSIDRVGATYLKDIMLKSQNPSIPSSGSWISAKVFGYRDIFNNPTVSLSFANMGDSIEYYASGTVVTNSKGEIFLEVSGQDPSTKGFISHRPYIQSIYGYYQYGKLANDSMILHVSGGFIPPSSQLPFIIDVENSAYVYNTLGLYSDVKSGDAVSDPSGLSLFAQVPSGTCLESLNLYTSGIGSPSDILNLRVRGK